jgi:beta-glucosidase
MSEAIPAPPYPDRFLWGASMAAHQVEGGNSNDWSVWEVDNAERLAREANPLQDFGNGKGTLPSWEAIAGEATDPENYISGQAVGNWERWTEDVDITRSLGMNALRYSVEWSRVEPEAGSISQEALNHYAEMTEYCLENGIAPIVTLHHFTNPQWITQRGSWEDKEVVGLFTNYVGRVTEALPETGIRWVVINEPNIYARSGWAVGEWPPQRRNPLKYRRVTKNLVEAHKRSYDLIKDSDEDSQVSSAVHYVDFDPKDGPFRPINAGIAIAARRAFNEWFQTATMDHQDFIALNHYIHCVVNLGLFKNDKNEDRSDLGWYIHPDSMLAVLREAAQHKKPIIITESGIADAKDEKREQYIKSTLNAVEAALAEGIDVRGYLHWSLLDNFEWDKGYWPKFGLVSVDRQTMDRTPKRSAYAYREIIESHTRDA